MFDQFEMQDTITLTFNTGVNMQDIANKVNNAYNGEFTDIINSLLDNKGNWHPKSRDTLRVIGFTKRLVQEEMYRSLNRMGIELGRPYCSTQVDDEVLSWRTNNKGRWGGDIILTVELATPLATAAKNALSGTDFIQTIEESMYVSLLREKQQSTENA